MNSRSVFDCGARTRTRALVEECRSRDDGRRLNMVHIFVSNFSLAGCWFRRHGEKSTMKHQPGNKSDGRRVDLYSEWIVYKQKV